MPTVNATAPVSRKEQQRLTRRKITDAARRCFYDQGVATTSIEQVAREAGVGRATLYLHFANKEEILVDLLASNLRGVRTIFARLDAEKPVDRAAARRWLVGYIATLREHRDAMRLMQVGLASGSAARELIDAHRAELAAMLGISFPALADPAPRQRARVLLVIARVDHFAGVAAEDEPSIDIEAGLDLVAAELADLLADQVAA